MGIRILVKIKFKKQWKNGLILSLVENNLKLHLIGGLQTNKVKYAVKLFDYIHSVDSERLAKKYLMKKKQNKKVKFLFK